MDRTALLLLVALAAVGPRDATADTFRIEIDYMVEPGPGAHSHRPSAAEIAAVVQMFACQGHTLTIQVDDAIPHHDVLNRNPADADEFFDCDGVANSFGKLKDDWFDNGSGWHYAVFGHQFQDKSFVTSGSSGLAEIGGDDFVVTLGTFAGEVGTPFDRAATLAHEFGHNLGLSHCGSMDCTDPASASYAGNGPPNVPSIMSYAYQLEGVRSGLVCQGLSVDEAALFKELDYSHGRMCNLDENNLDESRGAGMVAVDFDCDGVVGGSVAQELDYSHGRMCNLDENNLDESRGAGMVAVDFDCDGVVGGIVAQDLEHGGGGWCSSTGKRTGTWDYDEWSNISSSAKTHSPDQLKGLPTATCITSEEVERMRNKAACAQPTLATEACVSGQMMYLESIQNAVEDGRCEVPYNDVASAQAASPDGSVFFLDPGTYDEVGTVVLDRRLKLFSTGPAIIR